MEYIRTSRDISENSLSSNLNRKQHPDNDFTENVTRMMGMKSIVAHLLVVVVSTIRLLFWQFFITKAFLINEYQLFWDVWIATFVATVQKKDVPSKTFREGECERFWPYELSLDRVKMLHKALLLSI